MKSFLKNPDSICFKANLKFKPSFELSMLISSLKFTHFFAQTNRHAIYFGAHPYVYNGGSHAPKSFSSNLYILELFTFISNAFPELMLNSCLLNYYPDSHSSIPFHADDECCIDPDSFIVTLSLGAPRTLAFKQMEKRYSNEIVHKIELRNGEILLFSKKSQLNFLHGIPPITGRCNMSHDFRISATFRKIVALTDKQISSF